MDHVVKLGAAVLSTPAHPIDELEDKLYRKMVRTMKARKGVGIAAPQVGYSLRVFVYDLGFGIKTILNPVILSREDEVVHTEGCLSIPGKMFEVNRHKEITAQWVDQDGDSHEETFYGLEACVWAHEVDHLDGLTLHETGKRLDQR